MFFHKSEMIQYRKVPKIFQEGISSHLFCQGIILLQDNPCRDTPSFVHLLLLHQMGLELLAENPSDHLLLLHDSALSLHITGFLYIWQITFQFTSPWHL